MNIAARIENEPGRQTAAVSTNGLEHTLSIPAKENGPGSAVSGGELLFLALAACFCNDLYREARHRSIEVDRVEVEVSGEFDGPGRPAQKIAYRVSVDAQASEEEILELMRDTDRTAEIHNTLRAGAPVILAQCEARTVRTIPQR